ncbi:MAG TPA: hypothetical protein VGN17_15315 [Bryobacteraceae bacterium]|jgi:uncharacterized protein (TIGR03437 family)
MKIRTAWAVATLAMAFAGLSLAQPTITSIVDPFTGSTKLAPGGQAMITGTNLGLTPLVTVGGVNAFNLVQPQFGTTMTIQIPWTAALGTSVPVIVSAGGTASAAFNITLVQYAPVLISTTSGALTSPRHANGVGIATATPAAPGESVTFYAIGLGPTNPSLNTGALAPNTTTATTTTATVTIGSNSPVNATVSRLANGQGFYGANGSTGLTGSTQALIGIYVVTAAVPSGTATGIYPVSIAIGGAASNSVNLAVGPAPTAPVISAIVGETGKTLLCPGDIAILSGLNLGTNPTVTVAGKTAFNVTVNNGSQITIQIPVNATLGAASVTLATGGQTSAPFPITLSQFAPALSTGGNGQPQSALHTTNFTGVTSASPAYPGEQLVLLAYGLGPTNPAVPTGSLGPSDPSAATTTAPTVNLGGFTGLPANASLVNSGNVGVYAVIFTVPANVASGNYSSSISIGGVTTGLVIIQVFSGPTITNVENAASNIAAALPNSGIAQGAIFVLQGINLGPAAISIASSPFQSTSLSGTSISVTISGTTVAPTLYYTSAAQVAALMPSNTPLGTGTVTVTNNGQVGNPSPISVVQNNVGIFTATSDGLGAGIVTYPDYSLVSPVKAANCGGVYTTCGAANPGDTLTVWATGLGPVTGNETGGAGLGVDMTSVDAKLWLGGIQAKIVFKGRGCCIGEDQIAFVVPDNVPTGCAVPMAIQVGSEVSNYAVIAISPKGSRSCVPANSSFDSKFVSALSTGTAPITFGQVNLARQPTFNAQGQLTGSADKAGAQMFSFTVPPAIQPFIASYLDDAPLGTCIVYNTPQFADGGNRLANFNPLDAGPSFKVTTPAGSQNVGINGDDTILPSAFLSPGTFTVSGTGGANVGSASGSLTVPTPPSLSGLAAGNSLTVTRANGVTFNWTGGAAGSVVRIVGQMPTDNTGNIGASFRCYVSPAAGTFTVPSTVTLSLPSGNFGWDFKTYTDGTFTATGLSFGIFEMSYDTAIFPTLQ